VAEFSRRAPKIFRKNTISTSKAEEGGVGGGGGGGGRAKYERVQKKKIRTVFPARLPDR